MILSLVVYSSNRGRQNEEWRQGYVFELLNTASITVDLAVFGASEHGMFYMPLPTLLSQRILDVLMLFWLKRLSLQRC